MWHGSTICFLSDLDASQRNNIWAHDVATGQVRQITQFTDFDVTFPSIGPDAIVFQAGGGSTSWTWRRSRRPRSPFE